MYVDDIIEIGNEANFVCENSNNLAYFIDYEITTN